jgi:hypothetical protein
MYNSLLITLDEPDASPRLTEAAAPARIEIGKQETH